MIRHIFATIHTVLLLLLGSCSNQLPVPLPEFIGTAENSCLPEAVLLTEAMHRAGIEAKVVIFRTERVGHALAVFRMLNARTGQVEVWVWDYHSRTTRLAVDYNNDLQIVTRWFVQSGQSGIIRQARAL